jgi:hypothetical protein
LLPLMMLLRRSACGYPERMLSIRRHEMGT